MKSPSHVTAAQEDTPNTSCWCQEHRNSTKEANGSGKKSFAWTSRGAELNYGAFLSWLCSPEVPGRQQLSYGATNGVQAFEAVVSVEGDRCILLNNAYIDGLPATDR